MPIQKLEDSTVRVLGALQTLTDPTSLVKELIDNALDAHATSIAIEVSANTLDVIQLRDNGHGISAEDRPMIARPNCTSKITTDGDIKSVRGTSLGFRGQALASAAELSGSMTISTRIEGEQTAASLVIDRSGEVADQRHASHPVGTTVRITDFVMANPVRKQVLLKAADRTLKKLKDLVQSYAFARPTVRLALRIIKAKSEKNNFTYVPKPDGTVEDVAMKLVGSACTNQCRVSIVEANGMKFTAFMPLAAADVPLVCGIGTYIAVDGRPVSPRRGTLKEIVSVFRTALRAVNHAFQNAKEIFLYLDIYCPGVAYDPNIEPAKDDVLFEEPEAVVATARSLFTNFYEPTDTVSTNETVRAGPESISRTAERDTVHRLILQPTNPSSLHVRGISMTKSPQTPIPSALASVPRRSGFQDGPPSQCSANSTFQDLEELRAAHNDIETSNPWTLAKLNAPNKRPRTDNDENRPPIAQPDGYGLSETIPAGHTGLVTPHPSSPHPSPADVPLQPLHYAATSCYSSAPGTSSLESILQTSPSPHPLAASKRPKRGAHIPFQGYARSGPNRPFKPPMRMDDDSPPLRFGRQLGTSVAQSDRRSAPSRPRGSDLVHQGESDNVSLAAMGSLGPPTHNRDIRDFVASVHLTGGGDLPMPTAMAPVKSLIAAEQSTDSGVEHIHSVLGTGRRSAVRRLSRRKSSRLPLERTPATRRMQNVFCRVTTSFAEINAAMSACIEDVSFTDRNHARFPAGAVQICEPSGAGHITGKLRIILEQRIPAGQLVDAFDKMVEAALIVWPGSSQLEEDVIA